MSGIWDKYAKLLIEYSLDVKKGDMVLIKGEAQTQPLILALYEEILRKGGYPVTRIILEGVMDSFFKLSSDEQLTLIDPFTYNDYEKMDKLIQISAPYNVKNLAGIDPEKLAKRSRAVKAYNDIMFKRSAKGKLRTVICNFPCNALAQEANMSLYDYEQLLINACYLHLDDPVQKWREKWQNQQEIANYMSKVKNLHITGYKTDLKLSVAGRNWVNCCGISNLPGGEIFSSPIEDSAQGEIYFEHPAIYRGNEIVGIYLKFEKGKIVNCSAEKGEGFLLNMINQDEGAKRLGEIAFGTNDMIKDLTGNILFDEKIGGSIHIALGFSASATGGKNKSSLHWDIIKNMKNGGKVYADDKLIYKNGEFVI